MMLHYRPNAAEVTTSSSSSSSSSLRLPHVAVVKVEGGSWPRPSTSSGAAPGRTASPCINDSEEELSPPSSPPLHHLLHHHHHRANDAGHQREQNVLLQQVGFLSSSIRGLSSKAQAEGLSTHERELLKGQLLALELFIARLNLPQQQLVADLYRHTTATTAAILADHRPASPSDQQASGFNDQHQHQFAFRQRQQLHDDHDHHLGVMSAKAHKKRAKRTFNRACVHCGTQFTSQWRKGPAGASTLCNACGIRYARRLKKDAKADAAQAVAAAAAQRRERT